ncbi:MAG: tetratricopeptide repeat protein [Bacteroidia bacterium]
MNKFFLLCGFLGAFTLSYAQDQYVPTALNHVSEDISNELVTAKNAFKKDQYTIAFPILEKYKDHAKFDANSQFCLAYMYHYGLGTAENLEEAVKWYRKSAENGSSCAQNNLALMYEKGCGGLPTCKKKALEFYNASSKGGNQNARENLARMGGSSTQKSASVEFAGCL